jgi:hypothetical protein
MATLRSFLLGVAFLSLGTLATACGGKNKNDSTMENTGGGDDMSGDDMGGSGYGGMDPCEGHGDMSGGGMDPCEGGE